MPTPEFLGARGSNAGDDFHELWVLRHALQLLDPDTDLKAVTAEGLTAEDEKGVSKDTWDGVDCVFYYSDESIDSIKRITVDQVKYSSADPESNWTVSRLTKTTTEARDSSVIGRLAKAFKGLKKTRPEVLKKKGLKIRLISNQRVSPAVIAALQVEGTPKSKRVNDDQAKLVKASGLGIKSFREFARVLDLSQCGTDSRFAVEERIRLTVSQWTDADARGHVNDLLGYVRRQMMMPEAKHEAITKESILLHFGLGDSGGLFPCPSKVTKVKTLVARDATQKLLSSLIEPTTRKIIFHGEGGCGKTTALEELETLLPTDSTVLFFDCYGGGTYLDSEAYRHLPADAFLQLSNDLARLLRSPFFLRRGEGTDFARSFHQRLVKAAEIVAATNKDAFLVLIVDAADNSITAANTRIPPDPSFVHDVLRLGRLPANVRLVLSARSGRLDELDLPGDVTTVPIGPFSRNETAAYARSRFPDATDQWIDDFHFYSSGVPRVQSYAFGDEGTISSDALDRLLPNGKLLPEVFQEQLDRASKLAGNKDHITDLCSAVSLLPRPIPIKHLAAIVGLSELHVADMCGDLRPGLRVDDGMIGFGDEDFEEFLRERSESVLADTRSKVAEHLLLTHATDAYSAAHIAGALYAAGLYSEILELVNSDEASAIGDPVLRRETQLQRFKIAMKVCRLTNNKAESIMTLIRGAEALKTDTTILNTLIANPDLAAQFSRDRSNRVILRDPELVDEHGRLLFQRILVDARQGNQIAVREGFRQLDPWLERRRQVIEEHKNQYQGRYDGWKIESEDIAAETEAVLRLSGPERALASLRRWKPRRTAIGVMGLLAKDLLARGEADLLGELAEAAGAHAPWGLFLQVPLAVSGLSIGLAELEANVKKLSRTRFIDVASVERSYDSENVLAEFHEVFLTACEVLTANGVRSETLRRALNLLSDPAVRRRDRLSVYAEPRIDLCIRAHVLLERLDGRTPTIKSFVVEPPRLEDKKEPDGQRKPVEESDLELFVEPFIPLYDLRARLLTDDLDEDSAVAKAFDSAISTSWKLDYRIKRESNASAFRFRAAMALGKMTLIPTLDRGLIFSAVRRLNGGSVGPYSSRDMEILGQFTKFPVLHKDILDSISKTVSSIKAERMPANEKISGLVESSRILGPVSHTDAGAVFSDAIVVASDVDEDAIYELELFDPLASRSSSISATDRRTAAVSLAKIVSDTSLRLRWVERFPWDRSMRALTLLDAGIALAASSRWEDENLVGVDITLEPLLVTAVENGDVNAGQAVAFLSFLQDPGSELIGGILQSAKNSKRAEVEKLAEDIANDELTRFKFGKRRAIVELLASVLSHLEIPHGKTVSQLHEVISFQSRVEAERSSAEQEKSTYQEVLSEESPRVPTKRHSAEEREAFFQTAIDWSDYKFARSSEIERALSKLQEAARSEDQYIPVGEFLTGIAARVPIADRTGHLDALLGIRLPTFEDEQIGIQINRRLDEWKGSPAVIQWGKANRESVLVDRLPSLTRNLKYGDATAIREVLGQLGTNDESIATALIRAVERHIDSFDAPTIYSLIGLIIPHCARTDAERVLAWYVERLLDRIPPEDRDEWSPNDVPTILDESMARFLYSQLSDIDIRKRWRAAHVLRRLARFGEQSILDKSIALFERKSESSFRKPKATFYWLAARMWLLIAVDRIATESPDALDDHFDEFVRIAADDSFPHLLMRELAKSAALKLVDTGVVEAEDGVRKQLESANRPGIRRSVQKEKFGVGFDKYRSPEFETRFHFDQTDTLPYWYSGATRTFAKLDKKTFLETADKWIIDEWGVTSEPWIWLQDGRTDRLDTARQSLAHSGHGTLPVIERLSTHLEWHAMWCTVGELIQKFPLAREDADGFDPFAELTKTEGISQPPYWLADNHSSKPLEERFWFAPAGKVDDWLESISEEDFLRELLQAREKDHLIIAGDIATRSSKFRETISIESALVEPETARALLRAIQSVESAYDYRIPLVGEKSEIEEPPYRLLGWLKHGDRTHGLDEKDPFRREILPVQIEPARSILEDFDLRFVSSPRPYWEDDAGRVAFRYEAWSDSRWDDSRERPYYSGVFSDAWRLSIADDDLANILEKKNMDLIVEVRIQRRNRDYEYPGHSQEEAKEKDFDRVFLLRRDGSIETTDGRVGTWKAPGP